MNKTALMILQFFLTTTCFSQSNYWQQKVRYVMDIDMNVATNRFTGVQKIDYWNNSPDKLNRIFFHLYWNAFQPNSMMDTRSRELGKQSVGGRPDWDSRVKDRILNLKPDEIGFQKIKSIQMNGVAQKFIYHETILEVVLSTPILPGTKVLFTVAFEAQVPLQVRRSGRDNPNTGVRYSMSQWYPKICEYDNQGWHPTPYVAREFYGVWGDFDVNIRIDKNYKLGGTGVLANANEIGWGYDKPSTPLKPIAGDTRIWKFSGKNIHDFVWAADTGYKHIIRPTSATGPVIHVIYKPKPDEMNADTVWGLVGDAAVKVLPFIEKTFGSYPYPQYSFIHGGDGGMEYPMATLIAGPSLGTVFHEWMHSWYQMLLGTNEGAHPWMDEGFTSFADDRVAAFYYKRSSLDEFRNSLKANPANESLRNLIEILPEYSSNAYAGYFNLVKSGLEEPLSTHSDHYETNYAYSINSYSKGEIFLSQLGYIISDSLRDKLMLDYYKAWRYRHPSPDDFVKLAEDVSGIQLDWYKEYWLMTTKKINYGIDSLWDINGRAHIRIKRYGTMPMPMDIEITYADGSKELHYIPLDLMFGGKPTEDRSQKRILHDEWHWTSPTYILDTDRKLRDIKSIEVDPSKRMADTDRKNNRMLLDW